MKKKGDEGDEGTKKAASSPVLWFRSGSGTKKGGLKSFLQSAKSSAFNDDANNPALTESPPAPPIKG